VLQVPTAQLAGLVEVLHAGVPFIVVHTLLHAPQFMTVLTGVSQPFVTLPSQLPKPGAHWTEHPPLEQLGVSLFELQTLPHAPQLLTSVAVLVSQSVPGLVGQ
jgi:hypothetical protein